MVFLRVKKKPTFRVLRIWFDWKGLNGPCCLLNVVVSLHCTKTLRKMRFIPTKSNPNASCNIHAPGRFCAIIKLSFVSSFKFATWWINNRQIFCDKCIYKTRLQVWYPHLYYCTYLFVFIFLVELARKITPSSVAGKCNLGPFELPHIVI